jgi:hypothetical protein
VEPDFEMLSFEKAVELFKEWGFLVEQGPRYGEITLILEGPDHRSCFVCEPEKLPEMAASVLRVRWHTGAMIAPRVGCLVTN